jgi:uncharacterized phage infection (PIP) family protein YhgE
MWSICVKERDLSKFINTEVSLMHPLGFIKGTALWMEEVVNRFYYSSISSFVYFGAAILLVLIGIRQFSEHVSGEMVILGIAFESLMLLFMFLVMLFSPNDDMVQFEDEKDEDDLINELVTEIGEIGRDFAAVVVQMEQLTDNMNKSYELQTKMLSMMADIIEQTDKKIKPNDQMLDTMRETNEELKKFKFAIEELSTTAHSIKEKEIQAAVRSELEKILVQRVNS